MMVAVTVPLRKPALKAPGTPLAQSRMRWILLTVALLFITVSVGANTALASFLAGYVARSASKKVQFNSFYSIGLSSLHGFWAVHEVAVLDAVRQAMVRRTEVQDLPLLVREPPTWYGVPFETPTNSRVSLESDCMVYEGVSTKVTNDRRQLAGAIWFKSLANPLTRTCLR